MRHWCFHYVAQTKQFGSQVNSPGVFYYEPLFVGQVELIWLFTDRSVHICPQFCWKDFLGFWEILARPLDVKSVDSWFWISMWFNLFKYLKATANRMRQKLGAFICSNYQTCTLLSVMIFIMFCMFKFFDPSCTNTFFSKSDIIFVFLSVSIIMWTFHLSTTYIR